MDYKYSLKYCNYYCSPHKIALLMRSPVSFVFEEINYLYAVKLVWLHDIKIKGRRVRSSMSSQGKVIVQECLE